jgi:FKBP-type peptidyl-prolyl cis-trans isomerase SlyD
LAFEKGDLLFTNYTASVKDTGEVIETTSEEEAKKFGIADPERKYGARLVAVGEGWVLGGLDDEIRKMNVGERKKIELPPAKAFGDRDPTKLRMVPVRKFGEKASELEVGDTVELDNRVGTVRFIGSGRTQVDFNHRLAGKTLIYDLEVVKKLETDEERMRALIDRRFVSEGEKVNFRVEGGRELIIEIPEELFLLEGLQIIKRGISTDSFRFVPGIEEVSFRETYRAKKAEPQAEKQAAVVTS